MRPPAARGAPIPRAAAAVVALWAPYTTLNTTFPGPFIAYGGGLALAGVALVALRRAGLTRRDLGLRLALPSRAGMAGLGLLCAFIPLALALGRGQGWRPLDDLVFAPASALGQELYFRAALLPALVVVCRGRAPVALAGQALLFALWHLRAVRVVAPGPALAVLLATGVGGLVWGWQVQRDRTVLYAAAQHALFLAVQ